MVKASFKKSFIMFGSSILGMVLGFLVSIFNTQILGPEQFGDFKFIETVARFIASIVNVGFFISLTRLVAMNKDPSKEKKYVGLFTVIFGIMSVIGVIFYLFFVLLAPYFVENEVGSYIWKFFFIVPAIIGFMAIHELLKGLHKIKTLATIGVLPVFSYLVLAFILYQFIPINIDHVMFLTYGLVLVIVLSVLRYQKPDFGFGQKLVKELFKENRNNGRPIYFGSLAGVATTHIAGFSLAYFMDTTQVGFFMLALTICSPIMMVPSVLGTVFFKDFVDMRSIPNKVYYFSALSTVLALIVFYSLIEYVILTFYTEAFLPVSDISKYLIIGFIFHGFGDLINRFLGAKGKGKWLRNAAFLVGIMNVIGYTLLVKYFNINGAIITKILASCLYLVAMIFYYINFTKKSHV